MTASRKAPMTNDDSLRGALPSSADELDRARSDRLVRMFLDQTLMGVLLIDETGRIVEWNSACERLTGFAREKVIGRSHAEVQYELIPLERRKPARLAQLKAGLEEALRTGKPMSQGVIEYRYVKPDGSEMFGEQVFYPIKTDKGYAFASVIQDVTTRKNMEKQKQSLEAQLSHAVKMEAMGRLAGGMAHDFNNLLTAILGYTSLLMRRSELSDASLDDLREIEGAAGRAAALTSQLLSFSRRQVMTPQAVNLNEIVVRVSRLLGRVLGEDIRLVVRADKPVPVTELDAGQLEHCLLNLAVNARDAMAEGGTLTVETMDVEVDMGYCRSHLESKPGRYAVIVVSDTGCGIPQETLEHIFEPFFTTKEPGKGTGLGLSTVYGFVKQAGGFINVYSELGKGTVIRLYFPVALKEIEQPAVSAPKQIPMGSEHILVAEDEAVVRELVQRVLTEAGYTVHVAARPSEAVALAADPSVRIDALLSDIVMPEMSGKDLYEILRAQRPTLRVLFMSGYAHGAAMDGRAAVCPGSILEKPFSIDRLLRSVREALES